MEVMEVEMYNDEMFDRHWLNVFCVCFMTM